MRIEVEVNDIGIRDWLTKMHSDGFKDVIDDGAEKGLRTAANEMSRLAPVDTGLLKSTLLAARSLVKRDVGEWWITNGTLYTIRQNFEHKTKRHFVTKPFEKFNATIASDIADDIVRWLE